MSELSVSVVSVSDPWILDAQRTPAGNFVRLQDGVFSSVYRTLPGWKWCIVRDGEHPEISDDTYRTADSAIRALQEEL